MLSTVVQSCHLAEIDPVYSVGQIYAALMACWESFITAIIASESDKWVPGMLLVLYCDEKGMQVSPSSAAKRVKNYIVVQFEKYICTIYLAW